jgi:metal-sulfur cluster biosynthetic enzyme
MTTSVEDVTEAMKDVVDPELGINVVDLGLIYDVMVDEANIAILNMTLTSAACPLQDVIEDQTRSALAGMTTDVKMNSNDSDQGSDKKASTAVSVKAGASKGGNTVTAGQHNANFTSKTDGPKKDTSKPFMEKGKEKMNTMDKENYPGGAKTYVEAGSEMKGNDARTGMHKGKFSEKVPESDKDERIAHGIELKESYTKSELHELIVTESKKLAKKMILKNELNKLRNDLSGI